MKKNADDKKSEKMNPYSIDKLHKIPFWVKVLVLKYWFFGAINLFMLMGLGIETSNNSNWQWLAICCGLIGGAFYDLVINKIIMLWETDKHEGQYFSMIISKKYYAMLINIAYFVVLFIVVYIIQNLLGLLCHDVLNWKYTPGQEPFTFGLIVLIIDGLFLGLKDIIVLVINKLKNKNLEK